ncbi:MAG: hypothetical protein ACYC92_11380 [Candidatus Acidiferrales bacterium]
MTSAIRSSYLLMINAWDQPYAAPPNVVKISGAHRMTPAMSAGVESRFWEIGDIVKVVEVWEAALG